MTRCWKVESTRSGVGPREPRAIHLRSSRRPPRWTEWVHVTLKSQEGKQHGGSGHTAAWGTRKRVRHRFWVCLWGVSARHEQSGPSREKGPHPHGRASPRPLRTPWQKHTKEGRFSLSRHVHLSCCSWFSGMHAACSSSLTHIQKVCKSLQRDNSIPTQEHPKVLTQAILFWALGKSVLGKGQDSHLLSAQSTWPRGAESLKRLEIHEPRWDHSHAIQASGHHSHKEQSAGWLRTFNLTPLASLIPRSLHLMPQFHKCLQLTFRLDHTSLYTSFTPRNFPINRGLRGWTWKTRPSCYRLGHTVQWTDLESPKHNTWNTGFSDL